MNRRSTLLRTIVVLLALLVLSPNHALAYIDPGTGSLIIQMIIASLVAVGFATRRYWIKFLSFLRGSGPKARQDGKED